MERLRIVVGGYIGLYPTGGATWDYIQYPLGLKMLGHDVYYIEDTGQYPVFQKGKDAWDDATSCVAYLKEAMDFFGLKDKWAYRDAASGKTFGMSEGQILEICKSADIFINISCSTFPREEFMKIPKRVLIDSDPMFTQVQYALELEGGLEASVWSTIKMLQEHNYIFTFGENIGATDCRIPLFEFKWNTTRQPICIEKWQSDRSSYGTAFTSIMNWSGRKKLEYANETWGQKDVEFERFKEIPKLSHESLFEVIMNRNLKIESSFDEVGLRKLGWKILDPSTTIPSPSDYQNFIWNSFGELNVAKETYVKANTGWFSCRSACYLAAGKPVIAQDTRWSKYIPSGEGLFAFDDIDNVMEAIEQVKSDYKRHSSFAKEIASQYFDSNVVLQQLLNKIS